jgi:hypothetical protein
VGFTAGFHPTSNTISLMGGYKFFSMVQRIEPGQNRIASDNKIRIFAIIDIFPTAAVYERGQNELLKQLLSVSNREAGS